MMTGESIHSAVRAYIIENFLLGDADGVELTDYTALTDAGVLDSTGAMEVVSFLEERFEIKIEDEDIPAKNLNSLRSICEFVQKKLGD